MRLEPGFTAGGQRAATKRALAAAVLAAASALMAAPVRYGATLCVTLGDAIPSCGPAVIEVATTGNVQVQVSDIVYRLRAKPGWSAVTVSQGAMQIDGFDARVEWKRGALHFTDASKQMRYEVRMAGPLPDSK